MTDPNPKFQRSIRSFVKREGKITSGQNNAIEELWPAYGVDLGPDQLDLNELFKRDAFTILEIGFGNGLSLAEMASVNPQQNFFGIEVHRPGVGSLLVQVKKQELENVRVSQEDAVEVVKNQIPAASLDRVQVFFPDPWHKKRHHKRRLLNAEFVGLLVEKLKPGATIHVATDWENYAEQILEVLNANQDLENTCFGYAEKPEYRPHTKYEARGIRLGHGVWDVVFSKKSAQTE